MIVDTNALFGITTAHLMEQSNGHYLNKAVVKPFHALQQAAQQAGFNLQLASSFRSFERQLAIWNAKFCGAKPILNAAGEIVDIGQMSQWQICQAILLYSALPGTSRHHWGTDFDFYDAQALDEGYQLQLIASEYNQRGPCAPLTHWLMTNANEYGFFFPYRHFQGGIACEPWHISYFSVAQSYLAQLTPQSIEVLIGQSNIEGKSVLLEHIDEIFQRYVTNLSGIQ